MHSRVFHGRDGPPAHLIGLAWFARLAGLCCAMMNICRYQKRRSVDRWSKALLPVWIGLLIIGCSFSVTASVIEFPDPGLEAAVRMATGLPTGDLSEQDVLGITTLDARFLNITDLTGIEFLVNLTELDLYGNQIADIQPLSALTQLTTLILSRNRISDIGPLATLSHLSEIQLRSNLVQDIHPLIDSAVLPDGVSIGLSFNPLPVQPGSPGMRDIEALQGRGMHIDFAPIVVFADGKLEAAVREAIGKLTDDLHERDVLALTTLDARYRGIADLEGIEHLVNLTQLDLSGNQIETLGPLSGLTKLTKLNLENNEIVSIEPLAMLSHLETLYLDNNHISGLSPLANLVQLITLYLWDNEIADLTALAGLENLTGLYLYFNDIVDISPLANLTQLTGLGLSWNQIVELAPLSSLTHLQRLYLDNNLIVSIASLVDNEGLNEGDILHLQGNPLPFEPDSESLKNLQTLQERGILVEWSTEE